MHRAFLSLQAIVFFASILFLNTPSARGGTSTLVPPGARWKYLDNGSNQGTAWRAPTFNDSGWASGPAELGYGDGGEASVVSYGPDANNKYITTYFRHAFNVTDVASFTDLALRVVRDDGVVVYLNGQEVYRNNMPSGTISYTTLASAAIGGADESTFYQTSVSPALLVEGANVLAVEIHQSGANSSDISFNLELSGQRQTMQIALSAPADGAAGASLSPTLDVSVSHGSGLPMTVTFYGRPAPPVGPDFSIVALPDTQFYSSSLNGGTPQIFVSQTEWILANLQTRNIVFTTHLGDIVQNGDNGGNDLEWRHATNALYRLEDPVRTSLAYGLPYGLVVGNHDQSPIGTATGTTTFYNQYFGVSRFSGRPYYGGNFGSNNDEHFELFSASGLDFIIIHLEYDTGMTTNSAELLWANELLHTYSSRQAIIVSHHIVNTGNPAAFSGQGQAIYNALKHHPNLFLMLCGHVCEEGQRTDVYNGTVYTLLSDYQCRANGGNGWLRVLEFSPANSVIRVRTYSPTLNQFETDANSQFDLYYDMKSLLGNAYATIAVNSGVPSGSSSTAIWAGLATSADYEWYVAVSDGVETVTSPVWRFRTADETIPLAPTTLTATAQSSTEIVLAWADSANNEAGFEIYQSVDGVNFTSIGTMATDVTGLLVTGLQPSTTYYYMVRAFNGAGYSADSNIATATTLAPPPPPAAPTGLTAAAASETQVTLAWTDNANNELGFRIERSTDGVSFNESGTVAANVTVFSDTGLSPFTLYYYRVRAYNSSGNSDSSEVATVTTQPPPPPPAPTGLTAVPGDRSVSLTWDESPGANRYFLYRSEVAGGPYSLWAYGIFSLGWADNSVTPHTAYFYVVTAANENPQESPYSNEASATPYALPAAPTAAAIAAADVNALAITWNDNATDETGYRIEHSLDNVNFTLIATLPVDSIIHWDEGLSDNTTYHYRIKAFNDDGESAAATVSGTTAALPANAPSNLAATTISSSQINLAWIDNANNENGFKIERAEGGGPFVEIALAGVNATSYSNTGLMPATTYTYRVRAFNPAGDSAYVEATAATLPLPPIAPSALSATTISSSQIDLTWTDNANNEGGFTVERSDGDAPFAEIAVLGPDVNSYSNTGLTPATGYSYRVRAYNAGGYSGYAGPSSASTLPNPPVAPTGLSATAASATQINLAWTDNANNETSFQIERKIGVGGSWNLLTSVAANATSYSDTGLTPNSTYYYRVSASNAGGYSPYSNDAGATTPAPTSVTLISIAAQDGYLLEGSENSNNGNTANSGDNTTSGLRAGDDNKKRQYKSIVSFDTSSIPDGATIVSATLRLRRGTISGTNPFQTHGNCYVDIKSGSGFNNSTALTKEDFQAGSDSAQVGTLSNAAANGQWSEGALNAQGLAFVNKIGTTQCRVYFQLDDNNNSTADFIGWYAANNATADNRPQLIVVYY